MWFCSSFFRSFVKFIPAFTPMKKNTHTHSSSCPIPLVGRGALVPVLFYRSCTVTNTQRLPCRGWNVCVKCVRNCNKWDTIKSPSWPPPDSLTSTNPWPFVLRICTEGNGPSWLGSIIPVSKDSWYACDLMRWCWLCECFPHHHAPRIPCYYLSLLQHWYGSLVATMMYGTLNSI